MTFDRLRAKSGDGSHASEFLAGHLADAYQAAQRVLNATAEEQLIAFDLSVVPYYNRLRRIVSVAAIVHDLGKANDHFQGMIYGFRDVRLNPQGLRHEWVTLLMLEQLREWLLPSLDESNEDFAIMEWAVAGHHPAIDHKSPPRDCPDGAGPEIMLLAGHDDYRASLLQIQSLLGLTLPPPVCATFSRDLVGSHPVFDDIIQWSRSSQKTWDRMKSGADGRSVATVKDCLVAADVAGSALAQALPDDPNRWHWITRSFAAKPEPGDLAAIAQHRLGDDRPRDFQRAVEMSSGSVAFVKAGCGSGKTLAAYLWAAAKYPTRRLYFCYPTTGTATEGFRDYLYIPETEAVSDKRDPLTQRISELGPKLFHSRRDIDYEIILSAEGDSSRSDIDLVARMQSLEAWSTSVVSCTVDTVLGVVQNNRRGLYAWPALAQSAFVFDEIHAYDEPLFAALLRFLRDLPGLPVLLMTASLPASREAALQEVLEGRGQPWQPICGPVELETRPRYRKGVIADNDPLPIIRQVLASGGKVLWVCNTVGRVMHAADWTNDFEALIYHSRFKYEDRVARHKAVIEAFKQEGPVLAICSQVAEMSLDLSADLLVTDLAPVPAMIQRLGRLNRRAKDGDPTKPLVVVEPSAYWPYVGCSHEPDPPGWPDATYRWLEALPDDAITQSQLAAAWEQTVHEEIMPGTSAWLDGGPITEVRPLRGDSQGITVLMQEDEQRVRKKPKDILRYTLPMPQPPRSLSWQQWQRVRGVPVAPTGSIIYDKQRGAEWQNNQ